MTHHAEVLWQIQGALSVTESAGAAVLVVLLVVVLLAVARWMKKVLLAQPDLAVLQQCQPAQVQVGA